MSKPFSGERRRLYILWAVQVRKYNPNRLRVSAYQQLRDKVAALTDSRVTTYLKQIDTNLEADLAPPVNNNAEKKEGDN